MRIFYSLSQGKRPINVNAFNFKRYPSILSFQSHSHGTRWDRIARMVPPFPAPCAHRGLRRVVLRQAGAADSRGGGGGPGPCWGPGIPPRVCLARGGGFNIWIIFGGLVVPDWVRLGWNRGSDNMSKQGLTFIFPHNFIHRECKPHRNPNQHHSSDPQPHQPRFGPSLPGDPPGRLRFRPLRCRGAGGAGHHRVAREWSRRIRIIPPL